MLSTATSSGSPTDRQVRFGKQVAAVGAACRLAPGRVPGRQHRRVVHQHRSRHRTRPPRQSDDAARRPSPERRREPLPASRRDRNRSAPKGQDDVDVDRRVLPPRRHRSSQGQRRSQPSTPPNRSTVEDVLGGLHDPEHRNRPRTDGRCTRSASGVSTSTEPRAREGAPRFRGQRSAGRPSTCTSLPRPSPHWSRGARGVSGKASKQPPARSEGEASRHGGSHWERPMRASRGSADARHAQRWGRPRPPRRWRQLRGRASRPPRDGVRPVAAVLGHQSGRRPAGSRNVRDRSRRLLVNEGRRPPPSASQLAGAKTANRPAGDGTVMVTRKSGRPSRR